MTAHGSTTAYRRGCRCSLCGEAKNEAQRQWRKENPEKVRAQIRRQYAASGRERARRRREAHPEKSRAAVKRYAERHPERVRAQRKRWNEQNRDRRNLLNRRYQERHPEKAREWKRVRTFRRRARLAAAKGTCTAEQVKARIKFYGESCWMCGAPWEHMDHVIPVAAGGTNWPANLRPACASCNLSKGAKLLKAG